MSVQSQIDRLNAIKQRIRTNLVAQGITVPDDTKLEAMAEQILSVAGEDGYTPVRGIDYWTEEDKNSMIQDVIDVLGGTPIFGTVDANNNIILSGALADGTYTIKYEDEDGNVTVIGTLNHTYVPEPTYTNVLIQAINSDGTPYNGGQGWKTGYRLNSSSVESANEGMEVTGFIPVKQGDVVRFANIQWPVNSGVAANKCYVSLFKSDFSPATSTNSDQCFIREIDGRLDGAVGTDSEGNLNEFAVNPEIFVNVANWSEVAYMRVSAYEITADSIITKNESIN